MLYTQNKFWKQKLRQLFETFIILLKNSTQPLHVNQYDLNKIRILNTNLMSPKHHKIAIVKHNNKKTPHKTHGKDYLMLNRD